MTAPLPPSFAKCSRITILDEGRLLEGGLDWGPLEALGTVVSYNHTEQKDIAARAAGSQILLTNKTPLDTKTLAALPDLAFISVLATGYNVVDVEAAHAKGIAVSNVPSYGTETVAQHTWALILELCNRVGSEACSNAAGAWAASGSWTRWEHPMCELAGKRLALIGRGAIAQRVAAIGRAFGMDVVLASISQPRGGPELVSIDEARATADVLSLHCRLTPASEGLVGARFLEGMKRSAFLVNTARGALIEERDLAAALQRGDIAGAALDVLRQEPPSPENPLPALENCLVTGHMAWSGRKARQSLIEATIQNVQAFLEGAPVNVVNP